jgi:hypothetical protein
MPAAAISPWATWDAAAQGGAYFLEVFAVGGIVGPPVGPPFPVVDSDTVDSPIIAGDWAGGAPGWFDDWGCIGLALRAGEAIGYPTIPPPVIPNLAFDIPGNYTIDDAIELGDLTPGAVIWPVGPNPPAALSGLDGVFPVTLGVPTHGSARPLDLLFLGNSIGVGADGVASNARAAIQWGEMEASAAALHNPGPSIWRSAVWGDFSAYANLAALGNKWDANNTAWGVAQLALFGEALSVVDPAFLVAAPSLSSYLDAALNSLTVVPANCDPLYYFALGLAVREFVRENDIGRQAIWVPVLLAGQQGNGGWYNPACAPTLCNAVLNTAGAMIGLDAVSEQFYSTQLKNGATFLAANQLVPGPPPAAGWCGDSRDQWPTYALFKFLEDTTAPSVTITAPSAGATICGASASITATATDNVDVQRVEFWVNGLLKSAPTVPPYTYVLDTTLETNCAKVIAVKAYDYAGNTTTVTQSVSVDNLAPTVTWVTPSAPGLCVHGTASSKYVVEVNAVDTPPCSAGVSAVIFDIDGVDVFTDTAAPWRFEWDTTDTMGGTMLECTHTLSARALDFCPNTSITITRTVLVDNTPPTISLVSPLGLCLQDNATFVVQAHDAKCGVYLVRFTLGALTKDDTTVTAACVTGTYTWGGVNTASLPDGAVNLNFTATDRAGNVSTLGTKAYKVNNTGPAVALTVPLNGATVTGAAVVLSATATDADWGVQKVEFWLNAVGTGTLIASDPASPYSVLWNSTTATEGTHALIARAFDNSGGVCLVPGPRTSDSTIVVTVDNAVPTSVAVTAPLASPPAPSLCGVVNVQATAADSGSGIQKVDFYRYKALDPLPVDQPLYLLGTDTTADDTAVPAHYSVVWNTALATNAGYTLYAKATDKTNQTTLSLGVGVTVDNGTNPVATWTIPTAGQIVTGPVALTATAVDANGITKVEFWVDSTKIADDTTSPYSINWTSSTVVDCTHVLKAVAFDLCGLTDDDTIAVRVDNTAPVISVTAPTEGSSATGTLTPNAPAQVAIKVTATEQHATIASVTMQVWHMSPGIPYQITQFVDAAAPYEDTWVTTGADNGSIQLRVFGLDSAGNSGLLTPVLRNFTLNNASFADVPFGAFAWTYIERIVRVGVTTGCAVGPPKLFCPTGNVSRDQMAVFICRALGYGVFTPASGTFSDVADNTPGPAHWAWGFIERFYERGLTTGCFFDPGTGERRYCPSGLVTRAQMAVFIVRSLGVPPVSPCTGVFADVAIGSFGCGEIEKMYAMAITGGCLVSPLRYCPDANIRRDQMAVFLVRAYGIGPPP